jgi:hypothetical protein
MAERSVMAGVVVVSSRRQEWRVLRKLAQGLLYSHQRQYPPDSGQLFKSGTTGGRTDESKVSCRVSVGSPFYALQLMENDPMYHHYRARVLRFLHELQRRPVVEGCWRSGDPLGVTRRVRRWPSVSAPAGAIVHGTF